MIYLVGFCVAAKFVTRRLHKKNEEFAENNDDVLVHLKIEEEGPVAVAKVVR